MPTRDDRRPRTGHVAVAPGVRGVAADRGQTSVSTLGMVLLAAAIVGALFATGTARSIGGGIDEAVCRVTSVASGGECGSSEASEAGGAAASGGAGGAEEPSEEEPSEEEPSEEESSEEDCPSGGRDRRTGRDGDRGERPGEDPRNRQPELPPGCGADGSQIPGDESDGLTVGAPTPGTDGEVPDRPPPPPTDPGAGEYDSEGAGLDDRTFHQLLYRAADAAEAMGMTNAARHLRHYLDASGRPLELSPEDIMDDVPGLRDDIASTLNELDPRLREAALDAYAASDGQPVTVPFQTEWRSYYVTGDESRDWFYAMGGLSYSITGYVTVEPPATPGGEPRLTMHYKVHIYDRYNWDEGKAVTIGPVTIEDESMGELHRAGLAQEYDVVGTSDEYTREVGDGSGNVEPPPVDGGRDGRSDPGRPRG